MSSTSSETSATDEGQNISLSKSQRKYMNTYTNFIVWRNKKGLDSFSESVFLDYFKELSETKQPSTLWSMYSMLKATLTTNNDIKFETYTTVLDYLKKTSEGYKSKKSKVFSRRHVETFLNEAPDNVYLVTKVGLIFGIHGACRSNELSDITVDDIEEQSDQLLLVNLTDKKTGIDRSFVIREEYKDIVNRYQALRPPDMKMNRFFIRYHNGKCFRKALGKNRIFKMPQEIASYLKLPNARMYTGHCFRRTSATLLANSGAKLSVLKRHGGWKSGTVASEIIRTSIKNKRKIRKLKKRNIKLTGSSDAPAVAPLSKHPVSLPIQDISPSQCSEIIINTQEAVTAPATIYYVPDKTIQLIIVNGTNVSSDIIV